MIHALSSSLDGIRLSITVDDLFEWKGTLRHPSYPARMIGGRFTDAFAAHRVKDIYAFSNTAPTDDDPTLFRVFDQWVECGHHVGNHTHHHGSACQTACKRHPYGLGAYVQAATDQRAEEVAARIEAGMVYINGAGEELAAPFGGYKTSGNGREWGEAAFGDFLEIKALIHRPEA